MLNEWFEDSYVMYLMCGLCLIGLITKLLINAVYLRLVHASGNMSTSKNKLVRHMKLKFETFYKLKIGVNNVDIFVDKYVYKERFCGLLLSTWENIGGLMLVMCLLLAPISAILGVILKCGQTTVLYTFFTGVCASAILILVDNLFSLSAKKKLIKLNMKDYLENFLKARLIQEDMYPELFEQYRMEIGQENSISVKELRKQEKQLGKQKREQEKMLALEQKQKEREDKKRDKLEQRQAAIARREIERMRLEEEQKELAERQAEEKRKYLEEKQRKAEEKQQAQQERAQRIREEAELKAMKKRDIRAKKEQEERQEKLNEKLRKEQQLLEQNRKLVEENNSQVIEIAATKEARKKKVTKQDRVRESVATLKEEVQAQRELRNKERLEGKDPFNVFNDSKQPNKPEEYHINNFDMEKEMKVAAAKRKEEQIHKIEKNEIKSNKVGESGLQLEGRTPYENKVINEVLKEFFA